MNVLSLFGGIECGYQAFKNLNIQIDKYYSSEIDKYAKAIAKYNHTDMIELGDITLIDDTKLKTLDKIDWIIGGSPCQSFSNSGNHTGFDGKSGLYYEYSRILKWIKENNNKDVKFLLENVKMKQEWKDVITNDLSTTFLNDLYCTEINSKLVSAQSRPRIYWTNFKVVQPLNKNIFFKNIIDTNDNNYKYWTNEQVRKLNNFEYIRKDFYKFEQLDNKVQCLMANMGMNKPKIQYEKKIRLLTPIEWERLQTLPDNYTQFGNFDGKIKAMSDAARYKTIGNGWTVDIISHIINNSIITFPTDKEQIILLEKELKKYKEGFTLLYKYFDSISDDEQIKVAKQLKKLKL